MGQKLKSGWVKVILWGYTLLYHSFAWIYDFAAWIVSAGKWNDWIRSAGELALEGPVLDVGCGKGVLLQFAAQKGIPAFGIDESPQMLRYARRLLSQGDARLVRGVGQALPLKTGSFRHVTATFPAPYIFEQSTLNEIRRVLEPGGNVIILLTADVTGSSLHERIIRFLSGMFGFRYVSDSFQEAIQKPFREAGFLAHLEWFPGGNARLLVIIGQPV
jgi:ubiquinone/menaquinone biosynthesis C-methylase UbiE